MLNVESYVQRREEFKERNVNLVFIGLGGMKKAKDYEEQFDLDHYTLFLDQKRKSHDVLHFNEASLLELVRDGNNRRLSKEAAKKGFKKGLFGTGSLKQNGGVALVSTDKGIPYLHKCTVAYDYPDVDQLLKECEKQNASKSPKAVSTQISSKYAPKRSKTKQKMDSGERSSIRQG